MRCPYCNTLIIHRFNGNYTRMDKKRKQRHIKRCDEAPADSAPSRTEMEDDQ